MAKTTKPPKSSYVCSNCGGTTPKWQGQCPHCNEWNTLIETTEDPGTGAGHRYDRQAGGNWAGASTVVGRLSEVPPSEGGNRILTGNTEFDRVLGGGLTVGGVVLLGGDPGIGKSTLLLQTMAHVGRERKVLYTTGEESLEQVKDRAIRLGVNASAVLAVAETQLERLLATLEQEKPAIAVIDSIQTIYSEALSSAPGSVSQVRECAAQLTRMAKRNNITILLVGHVTKDGSLAGPRVLEHMVDATLYFEGDPQSPYRLIRAFKNRFGAINEIGAFEMTETGLLPVDNPSAMFLSLDRQPAKGACVLVMQEGQRSMLVEIQALVDDAAGNNPRRLAVGIDPNRLLMLLAVLHKHCGLSCTDQDVFVNAVGGAKAHETAGDMALCMALISSIRDKPLPPHIACFGEIGLTGEIRPVQRGEDRVKEAAKLGFKRIMLPERNLPKHPPQGVELAGVRTLSEAFSVLKGWLDN